MRVLMTADAVGGVWRYALRLAAALARFDVRVTLATMGPPPAAAQRAEVAALGNVDLVVGDFALEWMPDPWDDVARAGDWLLALGDGHDVVHLNGFAHAALPWAIPSVVVGHSCVLSWWRAVHGTDAPPSWDRYRDAVAAGLHAASLVVAPSAAMLEALRAHYGLPGLSRVIHNGADPVVRRTGAARARIVLCAGRAWDEAKNIAAVAAVAPTLPWPVYVAGDGRPADADAAGVVHWLGQLPGEELARWMRRAAVFAHPARYEPFGLAVLEAALAGCALVLGDIPTLRELWDGAACFVPPEDRLALGGALVALTRDAERRAELGRRAAARARRYGTPRMARAYYHAYRELTAPRRSVLTRAREAVPCAS